MNYKNNKLKLLTPLIDEYEDKLKIPDRHWRRRAKKLQSRRWRILNEKIDLNKRIQGR